MVEKVGVEVEMKEYKYEQLPKALEKFGNEYYTFLFFLFVFKIFNIDLLTLGLKEKKGFTSLGSLYFHC